MRTRWVVSGSRLLQNDRAAILKSGSPPGLGQLVRAERLQTYRVHFSPFESLGFSELLVVVLERCVHAVVYGITARRAYRRNKAKTLINPVFLRIEPWVIREPRPTRVRGSKTG
jgi:hypothetical protein